MVLCILLGLLLTGWAVKAFRTAHPSPGPVPAEDRTIHESAAR